MDHSHAIILVSDRSRVLVWDLPVRVFHWLFTGGFLAAAIIALGLGEHSPLFPFHAVIGLALVFLVALRLVWGLIGTRHARLGARAFSPRTLVVYLGSAILGRAERYVGANPGAAYASLAMVLIVLGLAASGIMLGRGLEGVKEVHEFLAYAMLAVVGVHLLGILVHSLHQRENIAASMVHGRMLGRRSDGISSARPVPALLLVAAVAAWSLALVRGLDPAAGTLAVPLLGTALRVGEEHPERPEHPAPTQQRNDDDEDDHEEDDEDDDD